MSRPVSTGVCCKVGLRDWSVYSGVFTVPGEQVMMHPVQKQSPFQFP